MEERIIDDEEARLIKIKRTKDGVDAVEDTGETQPEDAEKTAEAAEQDEEVARYMLEFHEGEDYDEDLVGLTPTQMKEELERREQARKEAREQCDKLCAEGTAFLEAGDFENAADRFGSAVTYDPQDETAQQGLWRARTKEFTDTDAYFDETNAEDLSRSAVARAYVLERDGEKLTAAYNALQEQIAPLKEKVESERETRREPFLANKRYFLIRVCILLAAIIVCAVGLAVSAYFTVRTQSVAPIVLIAVFGAGLAVSLILCAYFVRKLILAVRLCRRNETNDSTEEGRALDILEKQAACLDMILNGVDEENQSEQ